MGKSDAGNRLDGQRLRRRDRHGIGKTDGRHQGIDPVVAAVIALGMNPQVEVNLCRRGKSQGRSVTVNAPRADCRAG